MLRTLLLLLLLLPSTLSADCEVCTKVIDDVRLSLGDRKTWKSKPAVEAALEKYCKKKELGVREKKICYYLTPIKRDVAQPFSLGLPSDKVCKRLEKVNPEGESRYYAFKIILPLINFPKYNQSVPSVSP